MISGSSTKCYHLNYWPHCSVPQSLITSELTWPVAAQDHSQPVGQALKVQDVHPANGLPL